MHLTPAASIVASRLRVSLQVVVATCASVGNPRLDGRTFRMLVIDEATQATEPMTLIPLVRPATRMPIEVLLFTIIGTLPSI